MVRISAIVAASALVFASVASAQTFEAKKPQKKAEAKIVTTDAYPFGNTCMISGKPAKKGLVAEAKGYHIKVCCKRCLKKIEADPAKYAKKFEAAVISQQSKNYPLKVCPISGEKLGKMGKPAKIVIDNHLVELCCKGCTKKANKKKAEIIAKITDAAYKTQSHSKTMATCPVSGKPVGKKPVELMHGTTLVQFCCKKCKAKFVKNPSKFLTAKATAKTAEKTSGN